jgi:hypothetical protein
VADPLNRIISDIEGLIEKGGVFPPSLFGEVLTELLVLRKIRDIAVAQPGGRENYDTVHKDSEEEARQRKHEARHGREWSSEYEQNPNASEPPHGYYDKLRDRYWNAGKRAWESGIDRERARRSDDDIAEKMRQARERMESEAFWGGTHDKMAEINVAWGEVKSLRGIT